MMKNVQVPGLENKVIEVLKKLDFKFSVNTQSNTQPYHGENLRDYDNVLEKTGKLLVKENGQYVLNSLQMKVLVEEMYKGESYTFREIHNAFLTAFEYNNPAILQTRYAAIPTRIKIPEGMFGDQFSTEYPSGYKYVIIADAISKLNLLPYSEEENYTFTLKSASGNVATQQVKVSSIEELLELMKKYNCEEQGIILTKVDEDKYLTIYDERME